MDKTKIPRGKLPVPVQVNKAKASNSTQNVTKENNSGSGSVRVFNLRRNPLNRRSKSVTDLTSVSAVTFKKPPGARPLVDRMQANKQGTKRAMGKSASTEDAPKPKQQKVKIPDWDYKARYNDLLQRHTKLQDNLTHAREKLTNLLAFEEQTTTLQNNLSKLESANSTYKTTIKAQETQIKTLEVTEKDLQQRLSTFQTTCQQLEAECSDLKTAKASIQQQFDSLTQKHASINDEREALAQAKEQLEATVSKLQNTLEHHEELRRQLHNTIQDLKGNIRVFCRVRPASNVECSESMLCALQFPDENTLEIRKERESVSALGKGDLKQVFHFDRVFPPNSEQEDVFEDISQLVQSALDGYHVCIFAYGQTGSGKTHTMQGSSAQPGVIPRTINLIFDKIRALEAGNWRYTASASFLEIYNETVKDLLVPTNNPNNTCDILYNDGSVIVTNLKTVTIESAENFIELMEIARKNRAVAATDFNAHSSRSHAVTKIHIEGVNRTSKVVLKGSLNLVDLAGSESAKTSSNERMTETKCINKSLSTLGNVMLALHNKEAHVPYRNSKLTFLLQSCLGGNSKTLMFVNIAPTDECYNESLNSIRFGTKVKEIKIVAKKNRVYQ